MSAVELAILVSQMRRDQKRYFRTRDHLDLRLAKDSEERVDRAVKDVLDTEQPGLFQDFPPRG